MNIRLQHMTRKPTQSFTPVPTCLLQRKCAYGNHLLAGGDCEGCGKKRLELQRRAVDNQSEHSEVPPIVDQVLRSSGQPLDATTRTFMEPRFGYDFSQVRVHANAQAAKSARAVNALAYTVGNEVVFAEGKYALNTTEGRRLIAHELTHVIQQSGASSGGQLQGKLTINQPGDVFEHEADAAAGRVMAGAHASASLTPSRPTIQRETPGGDAEKQQPEKKEAGEVVDEALKTVAESFSRGTTRVTRMQQSNNYAAKIRSAAKYYRNRSDARIRLTNSLVRTIQKANRQHSDFNVRAT
jgi:hypothetical protein